MQENEDLKKKIDELRLDIVTHSGVFSASHQIIARCNKEKEEELQALKAKCALMESEMAELKSELSELKKRKRSEEEEEDDEHAARVSTGGTN